MNPRISIDPQVQHGRPDFFQEIARLAPLAGKLLIVEIGRIRVRE